MAPLFAVTRRESTTVIAEPVQGTGGVYPPPDENLSGVAQAVRPAWALLIFDEIVTGFGRCGLVRHQRFDVTPDMVTFAKAITSGYQPLGAPDRGAPRARAARSRSGVPSDRRRLLRPRRQRARRRTPTSRSSSSKAWSASRSRSERGSATAGTRSPRTNRRSRHGVPRRLGSGLEPAPGRERTAARMLEARHDHPPRRRPHASRYPHRSSPPTARSTRSPTQSRNDPRQTRAHHLFKKFDLREPT